MLTDQSKVYYQVKESLVLIQAMYDKFHKEQLDLVQTYPHMVREELEDYDLAVRTYFAVDRTMPGDKEVCIALYCTALLTKCLTKSESTLISWGSRV